uniref:Uncharacterized protein n=1 Tax=Medicago truncatula TaxID=3880 RepID=A2Q6A9_MEDTR|nr:hypothetical protein MtrDRAFT_AC174467g20v1 [Medicago truncatula]
MNISGKVEGATGGSWKDKEEIFEVGDHGMLRNPTEFYGFFLGGKVGKDGMDHS